MWKIVKLLVRNETFVYTLLASQLEREWQLEKKNHAAALELVDYALM